jgi:hypothetical protein
VGLYKRLKTAIKSRAPVLVAPLKRVRGAAEATAGFLSRLIARLPIVGPMRTRLFDKRRRAIFETIYRENSWGGLESRSGNASGLATTARLRSQLPGLIEPLGVGSLLDVPCGDFFWMQHVPLDMDYIGADIVPAIIESNIRQHAGPRRRFLVLDMVRDALPRTELILCRDVFVHFSFEEALLTLRNFKRTGATYLMTTTFVDWPRNHEATTGSWRPLNLRLPPFNLPEPIAIASERGSEEPYPDKSLGLWRLADIPD